jgi:hypothetical protein
MSLFYHFFKCLSLFLRLGSGSGSDQGEKSDPDPHQGDADPQHCAVGLLCCVSGTVGSIREGK